MEVEKEASLDIKLNPHIAKFPEENNFIVNKHHLEVDVQKQEMEYFMARHQELEKKFNDLLDSYE